MAKLNFNATNEEAMDDFSVVPADAYNVQITKSEICKTKAETGTLLKLQFKIIDGKFKGRIVFGQYNLTNPNAQAVEISKKQMKTLCDALGKPDGVEDSNEMHNIPLSIKVGVKPAQSVYAEQNEIKFYSKYEGPKIESGNSINSGNPASGNPASGNPSSQDQSNQNTGSSEKKAPWVTE